MKKLTTLVFVTLTITFFSMTGPASANRDCTKVKGNLKVLNNGNGTTSGAIAQGGRLNGATAAIFTSGFTPTPDPNAFSLTDDLTITTHRGVLMTHNVAILDVATGLFTAINRIDPHASSGRFSGATGVLYVNGSTADGGATFEAEIAGEICSRD